MSPAGPGTGAPKMQQENQSDTMEPWARKDRGTEPDYRALVEAANSIILSVDRLGRIAYVNPFGLSFFGFKEDEISGLLDAKINSLQDRFKIKPRFPKWQEWDEEYTHKFNRIADTTMRLMGYV